ncbi:MAG: serine/threonine-protein kinase RsbW [Roseivirga sp.]|jgi:serine/threonine-protein kinase RsbW
MNTISIEIPSMIENIRIVESFIDNTKEKYKLNDDVYGNIMIAVVESVNNAIIHGNKLNKEKSVELSMSLDDTSVVFTVKDQGNGFNTNDLPDPTSPENLTKTGGRGIFLMKHLADEVSFKNDGQQVDLTFYLG